MGTMSPVTKPLQSTGRTAIRNANSFATSRLRLLCATIASGPGWTYCDYTEEGYYKFKYLQSLEKKKWKKIKKELGNMVAKTANVEAKELISNLSHYITDQGEQNPNHGAHSSNEGAQSSSQGDPNSSQDDQELQALITPASDSSA
ncbi:uncharacterized protein LOC132393830 isoform X2 [Hypanus sabinus]|uniref:uncharacterized protein LOC132393830 isoform X2 n=1 Tax=Hypanus sabinus TaxID=79690 RepID=UPI0028C4515F|nr:uncharacterized protein LOC132393830 isoform X2 [Hypanus sabinus]